MLNNIIITDNTEKTTDAFLSAQRATVSLLVTDDNVERCCLPHIPCLCDMPRVVIPSGEKHKSIESAERIWTALETVRAHRNSLVINLGGGLISDLGGFAASCFKRGIHFINIATTLLAGVDASAGGKTGVNFGGLKNQIGVFSWPEATIIGTDLLHSLPHNEILSGYGEMIKTAFIADAGLLEELTDVAASGIEATSVSRYIGQCATIKSRIVDEDPKECGRRKILNFGHTAGHALESLMIRRGTPLPHGICVAYGIMPALILSHIKFGLPADILSSYARLVRETMPLLTFSCDDYPALIELMHSDKKNNDEKIRFTLLKGVADPIVSQFAEEEEIRTSFDIARDYLGI